MKFKVGDKVTVSDSELKATNKEYSVDKSMFKILTIPYCTVKNISGNGRMELEEISWIWHADDFELYESAPYMEVGDILEVRHSCYLNGNVLAISRLKCKRTGDSRNHYEFVYDAEYPDRNPKRYWAIDNDVLQKQLNAGNVVIIKQNKHKTINQTKKGSEKTMAVPYSTTEKLQYSKLSKENKGFYKAGFVDLYGDLTDDGKNFIDAYLRDKYKDEALKSILTTVKAVNEETKGDE